MVQTTMSAAHESIADDQAGEAPPSVLAAKQVLQGRHVLTSCKSGILPRQAQGVCSCAGAVQDASWRLWSACLQGSGTAWTALPAGLQR